MSKDNIFDKLTGLWIPAEIMRLGDLTATQKMLVGLAESFRNGLRLSNSDLSKLLGIDRRNVIYNIQRLRGKKYLIDEGPDAQHRILRVNSAKLSPDGDDKSPPVEPSGSDTIITTGSDAIITSLAQSSDAVITHKQTILNKDINKYSENSDEFRLSTLLFDLIRSRKPDVKKPNLTTWAKHIDLMIRRDNRTPERIEAVIRWCQQDDFWQNNILSTNKLREHFDKLELKMGARNDRAKSHIRDFEQQKSSIGTVVIV